MRHLYLFSGMAGVHGPPLAALRELYARPENARLFTAAIDAVDRVRAHVGADDFDRIVPGGVPLRGWLRGDAPHPAALDHSLVDGLLAHLYQLVLLQPRPGDGPRAAPVGAVGHSLGLLGAVAAGMGITGRREFADYCHGSVLMTVLTLVRVHQAAPPPVAGAGPMAAVVGVSADELRILLATDVTGSVSVAVTNGQRSHVLAGAPAALAALRARWTAPSTQFSYLRSTAPFHSPLLAPALARVLAERHLMTVPPTADRIAVPVFVADTPDNLQQHTDVLHAVLDHSVCRPLDWPGTVRAAVAAARPDQIVDFGPGPSARVFTRESLRGIRDGLRYRTVSPTTV